MVVGKDFEEDGHILLEGTIQDTAGKTENNKNLSLDS